MSARRYRATVEYDGTDFNGFQRQAQGERTVQETLESAVYAITGAAVPIIGAGRTDSGVHAKGQVVTFDADWRHGHAALERALNANLPADVAVRQVGEVPSGFHPRFDARRRVYEYTINNQIERSPLLRRTSWHVAQPLDAAAMNRASALLVGEHDFATFGSPPQGDNSVRHVFVAAWRREIDLLVFRIEATAFLYRMVRSLVGALCQVGQGRWTVSDFDRVFLAAERSQAGPTAPPQGLCLLAVYYGE